MTHVVKRKGHKEEFDERKIYASIYAACLNADVSEQNAEGVAKEVSAKIMVWITEKQEVTSDEIFRKVIEEMETFNKEAAFMYATHKDIS